MWLLGLIGELVGAVVGARITDGLVRLIWGNGASTWQASKIGEKGEGTHDHSDRP